MTYRPNPESLAGRVVGWFALNPDRSLSLDNVIEKFVAHGDTRNVHSQLIVALDHDMVQYDPETGLYTKGPVDMPGRRRPDDGDEAEVSTMVAPKTTRSAPAQAAAAAPVCKTATTTTLEKAGPRSTIDLTRIAIEDNVPMPPPPASWAAFFDRFSTVGQSAVFPASVRQRLFAALSENRKRSDAEFTRRVLDDGSIRIWRKK